MAPQELMRDGGSEPPIRRSLGPDHREGNRATRNLARGKCVRKKRGRGRCEEKKRNFGKYRVSDSGEEGE
jgi:hypothetical protein